MLSPNQARFAADFLSPLKLKLYFAKNLPMGVLSGIKLVALTADKSVATVKFHWWNKNPFKSIYFAVLSMAAELSTAAPAMLAIKGRDENIALIIVKMQAEFEKRAQTKTTFTCTAGPAFEAALAQLKPNQVAEVTAETIGTNTHGEVVARFYFTWSFKLRT